MGLSIRGFFKKGNLWASLEETLDKIQDRFDIHAGFMKTLKERDILLAGRIKSISDENARLKARVDELDRRLWDISTTINANSLSQLIDHGANTNPTKFIGPDARGRSD